MKINLQTALNNSWLSSEVMASIPFEALKPGVELGYHDVKLLINGHECEPVLLGELLENMASHIEKEAQTLFYAQMEQISDTTVLAFQKAIEEVKDKYERLI